MLEVCVASLTDALSAVQGGADRLELNVALELGGLTPTAGLVQQIKQAVVVPVIVMIRPRGAGFCYSENERQLMLRDAEMLLELGADGVACGALSDGQSFDRQFWASLVQLTGPRQTVFHRAIDTVASPKKLLAELIELGTTHVLTSGGRATAVEGAEQIAKLREFADNQIEILPAAGVTAENLGELIKTTGCDQVHGSFGVAGSDPGTGVVADTYPATSQDRVAAARRAMDDLQL
jgi:copper homeostasis protein